MDADPATPPAPRLGGRIAASHAARRARAGGTAPAPSPGEMRCRLVAWARARRRAGRWQATTFRAQPRLRTWKRSIRATHAGRELWHGQPAGQLPAQKPCTRVGAALAAHRRHRPLEACPSSARPPCRPDIRTRLHVGPRRWTRCHRAGCRYARPTPHQRRIPAARMRSVAAWPQHVRARTNARPAPGARTAHGRWGGERPDRPPEGEDESLSRSPNSSRVARVAHHQLRRHVDEIGIARLGAGTIRVVARDDADRPSDDILVAQAQRLPDPQPRQAHGKRSRPPTGGEQLPAPQSVGGRGGPEPEQAHLAGLLLAMWCRNGLWGARLRRWADLAHHPAPLMIVVERHHGGEDRVDGGDPLRRARRDAAGAPDPSRHSSSPIPPPPDRRW